MRLSPYMPWMPGGLAQPFNLLSFYPPGINLLK
jgi:hypothetical protein